MTSLVHHPARDCVSSLGIPVDNLSLEQTVEQIIHMAGSRRGRTHLVSTLNVDFLVNSLGTGFTRARHPELLSVLRDSDLVTADGFPIIWLSHIVGRPLQQRVCGSDLVPLLAGRAADAGRSLFLLGGGDGVAEVAADRLCASNPGLKIAGTAAPYIHTAGMEIANCNADDEAIVDRINHSGADILLVGLGNPKQELWFNRNRDRLKVGVAIGVGGTFEFIAGSVSRAPVWMQTTNLEWVYRITQDPRRLWRRYVEGIGKLALLTLPLLGARLVQSLRFAGRDLAGGDDIQWQRVWSSRDQSLNILRLPRLVSRDYLEALTGQLSRGSADGSLRLLDFSRVRSIELAAHAALFTIAEIQQQENNLEVLGISDGLRRSLAAARVIDVLNAGEGDTLQTLGLGLPQRQFSCRSYVIGNKTVIFLSGKVNSQALTSVGLQACLEDIAGRRDCILDLRNVSMLESSAIAVLAPYFCNNERGFRLAFSGAGASQQQMFRAAGLKDQARFVNDEKFLKLLSRTQPTT